MKTVLCSQEIVDRRRTKGDHKNSPCHYVTGELKKHKCVCFISVSLIEVVDSSLNMVVF